ncbi:MAG TPA: sugar phosphate isomerase/epimerase [Euzebyales bacterium]|nr:sugar phosphate isomerase/epimerase [Euzebyales bacterium]
MRLGLFTDCFVQWPLQRVVTWAAAHGYQDLEVAAWPLSVEDHATHIDVAALDRAQAQRIADLTTSADVDLVAVSYYDNLLAPDRGEAVRSHLIACCRAAEHLGVGLVGMFVGRNPQRTVHDDLAIASDLLPGLVDEARRRGVTLVVENCPMTVWHPDGQPGNLAYSPELWGWLADLGIGLNFDPSHLPPVGVDPVAALRAHGRPLLFQAKGVEVFPDARDRTGYIGPLFEADPWWRYRTPGLDDLDWRAIIETLQSTGYDGSIVVEQEDSVLGRSENDAAEGLITAHAHLAPLLSSHPTM